MPPRRRYSTIAFDRAEFRGNSRVENADPLASQQSQQSVGFGLGGDEFDHDGHVGRELEEMLFVQDAMTPESGDGAKCRSATDTGLLRLLEQPFEQRDMVVDATFMHVKPQYRAFHASPPSARRRQPVAPRKEGSHERHDIAVL